MVDGNPECGGASAAEAGLLVEQTNALKQLAASGAEMAKPTTAFPVHPQSAIDRATHIDDAGFTDMISVGYWNDPGEFDRWFATHVTLACTAAACSDRGIALASMFTVWASRAARFISIRERPTGRTTRLVLASGTRASGRTTSKSSRAAGVARRAGPSMRLLSIGTDDGCHRPPGCNPPTHRRRHRRRHGRQPLSMRDVSTDPSRGSPCGRADGRGEMKSLLVSATITAVTWSSCQAAPTAQQREEAARSTGRPSAAVLAGGGYRSSSFTRFSPPRRLARL